MHASEINRSKLTVPAAPGAGPLRHKTLQVTLVTNGKFHLQGDLKDEAVHLYLKADGTSTQLTLRIDEAPPALRIFDDSE